LLKLALNTNLILIWSLTVQMIWRSPTLPLPP
jgi:hypothetical protein